MKKLVCLCGAALAGVCLFFCAQAQNGPVTTFHINGAATSQEAKKLLPQGEMGTLPSLGTVRPLFILVNFSDYSHESLESKVSTEGMQSQLFGIGQNDGRESADSGYPNESLRAFFSRASYGRLQMEGDVLGWFTAAHERKYYEEHDGPPEILREALAYYDEQTDFSVYDSNRDGVIDSVALLYVTDQPGGWTSMWYNYIFSQDAMASADDIRVDKMGFFELSNDRYTMMKIITHEMGHFFRLPDYYDSDGGMFLGEGGMWSPDMMLDNGGDYNAFTKLMLGWMENVYVVTEGPMDITLRPVNEAGDMAIVFPSYTSPLSEYFVVEYITETKNNAILGEGIFTIGDRRSSAGGLRILRVNAEETKNGFKYNNMGTENKLIESVKKGFWEIADIEKDKYRLLLFREGEKFTPDTYPSSYGFFGQYTGVSVQDIRIAPDEASAVFTAEIMPKTSLQPITFQPVTEMCGAVSLIANTEIRLKGKTLPYLLIGKKKVPLELMDINASPQENRVDLLLRKKTGMPAGVDTPCKLVIPKGTFVSRVGAVNEETVFEITARFRDIAVEKDKLLDQVYKFQYFRINDQTAGMIYFERSVGIQYLTISRKGKVSSPKTLFKLPENSYITKSLQLSDGSFVFSAASFADQKETDIVFISEDLKEIHSVRIGMPYCTIAPYRKGITVAGWKEGESTPNVFYMDAGMDEAERVREIELVRLLTTPVMASGIQMPCTYALGNGEWLYVPQYKVIKLAVFTDEGTIKAYRGWKEADGDYTKVEPYLSGIPLGAIRTGENAITLFMLEGASLVAQVVLQESSIYAVTLDNELNVVSKKFVRSYYGIDGNDFMFSGRIVRLSNGYALPLNINMTPEKSSASPLGLVCFLDEDLNYREEAWFQASGKGSPATVVELTPGEYFLGTWHSFRIMGR